jgi:hypothetical protein
MKRWSCCGRPGALALDQLHHDEGPTLVFTKVVDRDDVGMLELSGDLRLLGELRRDRLFGFELRAYGLDRDLAADHRIERGIDAADASLADFAETFETPRELARGWEDVLGLVAGHVVAFCARSANRSVQRLGSRRA